VAARSGGDRERRERDGVKPLLVVNPNAGGGRAGRVFPELRPIVERRLGPCDVAMTTRRGDAIDRARGAALEGRALVVAVGGDGTVHEVANGVLAAANEATTVGVIGQGSGGDLRRSLGLEHRLDKYLDAIASGRERRIDVGRATFADGGRTVSRVFVNVLSAGLGGLVDRYVEETRRAPPVLKYALASARALAASEAVPLVCKVRLAGKTEERRIDAWSIAVANGGSFGSGMRVAPMAALDDGRLEVVALTSRTRLGVASLGPMIYAGRHIGRDDVVHFACDAIEIALAPGARPRDVLLDVDGEPLGALPVRIEIAPRALRFRA
jgi:YegS/Rv2252/BmrU family lipid kinase